MIFPKLANLFLAGSSSCTGVLETFKGRVGFFGFESNIITSLRRGLPHPTLGEGGSKISAPIDSGSENSEINLLGLRVFLSKSTILAPLKVLLTLTRA